MLPEYTDEYKKLVVELARARINQYVGVSTLNIINSIKGELVSAFTDSDESELNAHLTCRATDVALEKLEEYCMSHDVSIEDAMLVVDRVYNLSLARSASQGTKPPGLD